MKEHKKPSLGLALIPIIFLIISLIIILRADLGEAHIALITSGIFAALIAMKYLNYSWKEIESGIVETIKMSMGAIIILMIIGIVVGLWIVSGVVPIMIYYGLKILSPSIFLIAACLLCCVVSLATGSSWTTAATVGIALVGVGTGLGIPIPMVAGAIISGSYFGDKMSPLSDTTNLAPAVAGADLFDHIRHMIFTTGPGIVISLILYGIIGLRYTNSTLDSSAIDVILGGIEGAFNLNPILLLVPVLVIVIVVMKTPAIPGLFGGAVLGGVFAMIFQKTDLITVLNVANNGYTSETGIEAVDSLLSRGGMQGMMWTISLILCAMIFGGVMEKTGMLHVIAEKILTVATSTGGLVTSTVLTCLAMNTIAGDQYLALVIPGRMYKEEFEKRNLHPKNLSRILEDAGTLTSPLIPWNTCGAYMIATLGVAPWVYIPYCFLNLINPIISIIYGFTGVTMTKLSDDKSSEETA